MSNWDTSLARTYHDTTKHSFESVRTGAHFLDWTTQPLPFKIYEGADSIPLPRDIPGSSMPSLEAIAAAGDPVTGDSTPGLASLTTLLHYSAGITRKRDYGGGELYFRAAACTGALYHIDLYVVCGDLADLPAGVYHYGPHDSALTKLRSGDYRPLLVEAAVGEESVAHAPAVVVFTCTYWRNSWKYQSRAYRHTYWDSGTILANFQSVAAAHRLPARLVMSFADEPLNRLLDLDTDKEVTIALAPVGRGEAMTTASTPDTPPLGLSTQSLSRREVDYPMIRAAHAASVLESSEDVSRSRGVIDLGAGPDPSGPLYPLLPPESLPEETPKETIEGVIQRRGSTRKFSREPIGLDQLSGLLRAACTGVQADFLQPDRSYLCDLYLTVHDVDGLPPGAYVYHRGLQALEQLKEGDFRNESGYLGLNQDLPADASANIFFLTNLDPVLERMGNRGYRAAQIEASITAGKCYLGAYAQRVGASGLTFFDDDVTNFFSPHAAGKSVMFLIALGKRARRNPR